MRRANYLLSTLRRGFTEQEIKAASGITNVQHNKGSIKDFQKIKDKTKVDLSGIVDTTKGGMDQEIPTPTTDMEKQVMQEKNEFSDEPAGGYSQKGSQELPLGDNEFVKSGQQEMMQRDTEETIRKPVVEKQPGAFSARSQQDEKVEQNKLGVAGSDEAVERNISQENVKEKARERSQTEGDSGGTSRSS